MLEGGAIDVNGTGTLLATELYRDLDRGQKLSLMNYSIHVGKILGLPGQLLALAASLAAGLLGLVAGNADALQPETWIGLYVATLASGALTIVLLGGVIAIAEGNVKPPMLVQMFATDALVTLINASIAIAAAQRSGMREIA